MSLDCRLTERLVAEPRGGRKVKVRARSNLVTLSALYRPHQCLGVENDLEASLSNDTAFLIWSFGPEIGSVDGICHPTGSMNRFYLVVNMA